MDGRMRTAHQETNPQGRSATRVSAQPETTGGLSLHRLGWFVGLSFVLGTLCAAIFSHKLSRAVPAQLTMPERTIVAPREAHLKEWFIHEGDWVEPGTPLFSLEDQALERAWKACQEEVAALNAELARGEAQVQLELSWRLRDIQREKLDLQLKSISHEHLRLHHLVEQVAWEERLLHSCERQWWQEHELAPMTLVTELPSLERMQELLRRDAAETAERTHHAQRELCQQRLRELAELERQLMHQVQAAAGIEVTRARLESAQRTLEQLSAAREANLVRSPWYGRVTGLLGQTGAPLQQGQTVLTLLDEDQMHAVASLPATHLATTTSGTKVLLRFPNRRWYEGKIVLISQRATVNHHSAEAVVAATIEPSGKLWPKLPTGTLLHVCLR
ncbi:MAG: hypothetical protein KatS3mg114_0398 [Planctomycetaceae bacterium]|nr:MAG: hypothetical protein KatS3mg114_0398 [Planctomycetaceae bacterium]